MIKFFRRIRKRLLKENKLSKYFLYAIGEILLVVIGILIAVGLGEWRSDVKKEKELQGYYQALKFDLSQDKIRLLSLDSLFINAKGDISKEIDKMQLSSYNQDSLYSNVPVWMIYVVEFAPNNSTFTEIISSGKFQLFTNKALKSQILNLYGNLYPDLSYRQTANNEFIRTLRTRDLMRTYRWIDILNNDNKKITNLELINPKVEINHKWLDDKQSEKYLQFENYLSVTRAAYIEVLIRYKSIVLELENLIAQIDQELDIE